MTTAQQLRLTLQVHAEAKRRQVPAELVPILNNSFLSWLERYPDIIRTRKHLAHCLEAYVQGWLKGSLDFRISQQLTHQETSRN